MAKLPRYFHFVLKSVNKGTAVEVEDVSGADFEEVVRCRDCKYADSYNRCEWVRWINQPSDYCSRGEKRK